MNTLSDEECIKMIKFLLNFNSTELGPGAENLAAAILRAKTYGDFKLFSENVLEETEDAIAIYKEYLEGLSVADATALVLLLLGQIGRMNFGKNFFTDLLGQNNFDLKTSRLAMEEAERTREARTRDEIAFVLYGPIPFDLSPYRDGNKRSGYP